MPELNNIPPLTTDAVKVLLLENNEALAGKILEAVDARIKPFSEQAIQLATNDGQQQERIGQLKIRMASLAAVCGTLGGFIGFIAATIAK